VRWRLWFAFAYCVQPINLIPDFIPVIGFVDNIVILTWALRSTVNRAGNDTVIRNWTGTHDELAVSTASRHFTRNQSNSRLDSPNRDRAGNL
jgi:uncharacterized membrane protein YkvA (DUF1232 family)